MKNYIFSFALFFFSLGINKASNRENLLLQQLIMVNSKWRNQTELQNILSNVKFQPLNYYSDCIALHLSLVEKTLRNRNASHLSAKQLKNRLQLLDKLNRYWQAKTFPINNYTSYKTPVFIDKKGTHCAVGYLMQQSGYEALAKEIDAKQKFAYVHQIKVAGVNKWANEHGFTIDELAWIQPGYPPTIDAVDMKKGFDGPVNAIVVEPINGIIYAAGSFTKATEGMNCNNIAAWISGFAGYDWITLNNGVNGTVHALLIHNNKLYVGGEFTEADGITANHVAVYDLTTNQWQSIGSLDSTVRVFAVYNNEIYAGGDFTGLVSKWDGSTWQNINDGLIYGESVRALQVYNNQLIIGGNFDLTTGALRKHVALYDGTYMGIMGMGTLTPVNDFEIHENKLFAACDFISGNDTCALAVFDDINNDWKVELKLNNNMPSLSSFTGNSFNDILSFQGNLLVAGDFNCSAGMIEGNNLATYSKESYPNDTILYSILTPYLNIDSSLNCLATYGNDIYFGGDFISNMFSDTLNHIGYISILPVGIQNKTSNNLSIKVFPNPTSDFISIKPTLNNEKISGYEIYDAVSKYVSGEKENITTNSISFKNFQSGIYAIKVLMNNKAEIIKVVKQ